ncbi:hypothetical protein GCM10022286_28910 [Gryllotalpicola daejeonensis]|uniref:Hemagglutinin n=1 Tax=Gryllotalpicola daejeonensis TaxID=993087 RepID=A0ABP7ZN71_9MICO
MTRRLAGAFAVLVTAVAASIVAMAAPVSPAQPATAAAVGSQFQAGNIISDALFYNGSAMTTTDVQSFLNSQVTSCAAANGQPCLRNYSQATPSKAAVSGRCAAYAGSSSESAASIITKVGSVCGISQKALLVLLQKEQGLVTSTSPTSTMYRSATGYACPDTAACSSTYYGFFNQVYNAALQFRTYQLYPTSFNFQAGRNNSILYSPTTSCGSGTVYIQNAATAGLYDYTPYQPNAAALANLYGTGDSCSSYGNRNFWRFYTDWFGSTTAGSLVRTTTDATVYLVSGTVKYVVPNQQTLDSLAPLGPVSYNTASYLASFTTQSLIAGAVRIIRDPAGSMYFYDSGIKLPIGSCDLVVDYGGACSTGGYMQLTQDQVNTFSTGPALSNVMGLTTGQRYAVRDGKKSEILDALSQTGAGVTGSLNVLSPGALSALPLTAPIVRDGAFALQRGSSQAYLLTGGKKLPVTAAEASALGSSVIAGSLDAASLALIPTGSVFAGLVKGPDGAVRLLGPAQSVLWSGAASTVAATPVTASFLTAYPSKGTIAPGSTIKTAGSSTVYIVMSNEILPVGAWESLVALAGGKPNPRIYTVLPYVVAAPAKGPVALTSNTLTRSTSDATVYVINGVTSKIAMSRLEYATEAGFTELAYTTQARLNAYPRAAQLLTWGVSCGTAKYVAAGGEEHLVPTTLAGDYPFTYVPLDSFACAILKLGPAATQFIKTPNGSIYQLKGGKKLPISSMSRYTQLNGSSTANWLPVNADFATAIPSGPAA